MSLTATLKASFSWTATKTVQGSDGKFSEVDQQTVTLTDGTGSGNADLIYKVEDATIADGGGATSYDLAGALTDVFGDAVVFVKLKGLFVANTSDTQTTPTTAGLIVGGNAANVPIFSVQTTSHTIEAGGFLCMGGKVGFTVTASTGDIMDIDNADGNGIVRYTMLLIGATA